MRIRFLSLLAFLLLFSLAVADALAVGPVFWRVNTRIEVEKGDAQGVSIADNGLLTLAPPLSEVFDTRQAYIWSAVSDAAGNIYLGTGHEGRIFKVDSQGKGTLLFKTPELEVMALALDAKGNLYAGTAPDGKVYRVTPAGETQVFFDPKAKYIWSLAFDAQGRLLVGTGDKGIIFRVSPDGAGTILANTTQTNVTALGVDSAGNIIVGTDPGGLVLRISPEGRVFTLFDSSQREVRELAFGGKGEILVLTLAESVGAGASNAAPPAAASPANSTPGDEGVTINIGDVQVLDAVSSTGTAASGTSGGSTQAKSALYRLDANGAAETLWESRDTGGFALTMTADGRVLVGTGQKGRIFSVTAGQKPLLLTQSTEGQTARFIRSGERLYAATSNLGKLFRIGAGSSASGTYTSAVRDAQIVATWGRLTWAGEGDVELQTRSGNTAAPDSTWSDWSTTIRSTDGEQIKSPRARFIQWRATLKNTGTVAPRLREVTVSYLPRNIAPRVTSVTILPIGVALQPVPQPQTDPGAEQAGLDPQALGGSVPIPPRRVFQRGAISLQWQVEDRNGDTLESRLYYRAAAGGDYFPLKTELRENYFTIEPNALPDGRYVFKIVVSDSPSNPSDLALSDDQETEPVEIDNTPPAVTMAKPSISGMAATVEFQVTDATSVIRRAEYQLDGGEWQSVYPVDGIADSRREDFRVKVNLPDSRAHALAFRVFDSNANVGSAQLQLKAETSR
jgi:hypothetical protein